MRVRRLTASLLAGTLLACAVIAPAADAKKKGGSAKVGGTLEYTIPSFDPASHISQAPGTIRSKQGCQAIRVVTFAYFRSDGVTPASAVAPTVVTAPSGSFVVALTEPTTFNPPETFIIRGFAAQKIITRKGKKVTCKPIFGPGVPVTVAN